MKKLFTILFLLTIGITQAQITDLFISEYIEGGSNNKAIEIYNGTGASVDLSNYIMLQNSNSGPLDEYVDTLSGILADGDVYVIANASSDSLILAQADITGTGICYFNGDDARALAVIDPAGSTSIYNKDSSIVKVTIIDVIGTFPDDPGSGWNVAGTTDATKDHSLVRKSTVTSGNTDWAASAGTNATDSEWEVYPIDTFDYLGQHPGTTQPTEPTVAAPTPTLDPANVISLFSNAYTNVNVDSWSTTWDNADVADVQVAGNDTKLYTNLVYAGVETTTNVIDASEMTRFHMDIWTPDPSADPAAFKIKLVDFGADGAWSGGDDVEHEISITALTTPALETGKWVSIDLPLSDFTGLVTKAHLAQYIISGDPNTVYVDNIFFYKDPTNNYPKVFFSEYIEGSSNNKAIEIYNATDASVSLDDFIILNSHNGDGWSSSHNFPTGATLASQDVWVIVADQISSTYYDASKADEAISYSTSSPVHFNGDDARALAFIGSGDTTIIDIIGDETVDPGSGWTVGDTSAATANHTLVRKETVTMGNTNWTTSAGTNATDSEWEVYAQNTFDYLGQHPGTAQPTGSIDIVSVTRDIVVPDATQDVKVTAIVKSTNIPVVATLIYSSDGVNITQAPMSSIDDSTFQSTILATNYSDGTFLGYMVTAEDNQSLVDSSMVYGFFAGKSPIDSVKHADGMLSEFHEISARVIGVCTVSSGVFSTGRIESNIQDASGAIKIFKYGSDTPAMTEGKEYTVTGNVEMYKGLLELVPNTLPDDIVENGDGVLPDPMIVSISDLLANPEYFESMLIKIQGANLSPLTPWTFSSSSGENFTIFDGTADSLALRIDADIDAYNSTEPNWPRDVVGLLGQYDSSEPYDAGYQLLPRRLSDFMEPSIVPVELTSFSANVDGQTVTLKWETATEVNNNGFEIQRAGVKKNWQPISFIDGNNGTEKHSYSFTDKSDNAGKFFYRLKQLDFDGTFTYSNEVEVNLDIPLEYNLSQNYPNPFNPSTVIKFSIKENSNVTLKVFNVLGQEVKTLINKTMEAGKYNVNFNALNLTSGIYYYRIQANDFVSVKKMMLLK